VTTIEDRGCTQAVIERGRRLPPQRLGDAGAIGVERPDVDAVLFPWPGDELNAAGAAGGVYDE
jgi:hypothetical protein